MPRAADGPGGSRTPELRLRIAPALRAASALLLLLAQCASPPAARVRPPNVLLLVADDLGYSDLGCYGSEIRTPNLDALAAAGLRFGQFYNTARCWPSRAAILTGYYAQSVRRDEVPGVASGTSGTRPAWAPLLPDLLRPLGYRSYHSGKWHIDGRPLANGFDHSYRLDDHDRYFAPRAHSLDDAPLPTPAADSGYYATAAIADHTIAFLQEHAAQHPDAPFFAFVAFTAPHFPLQAEAADIAHYRGVYAQGWDAMRAQRWQRMRALALGGSALSPVERDLGPPYAFPEALRRLGAGEVDRPRVWTELDADQREFQAQKMAVHAAMVDRMDREIGRLLAQLRAMGAEDDTLVLFLSDNGASAEMMVRGDGHDPHADCGTGATFLSLGPGWSTMANTPFRRHKTWVHEGGISTPLVVRWPRGIPSRGAIRQAPGHVIDLAPTILALAGGQPPATWHGVERPAWPGTSLAPAFAGDDAPHHEVLWWQHEGNRALRVGNWKLVAAGEGAPWELYDLGSDRSETDDLARAHPERVALLAARWTALAAEQTHLAHTR